VASHAPIDGSRRQRRHRSVNGNMDSSGRTSNMAWVVRAHVARSGAEAEGVGPLVDVLLGVNRDLRYGRTVFCTTSFDCAGVCGASDGQVAESMAVISFEETVSRGGTCVNKIGSSDIVSILGMDMLVWGCAK
jgi:hypothetical protein